MFNNFATILSLSFDFSQGDCVQHILLFCLFFFSFSINATEKLRLIAEQNIPPGEKFKETEIGGLSGLVFDEKTKHLLAISDDRSIVNNARFYEFELVLDEKQFLLKPNNVVVLLNNEGKPFTKKTVYFKGITLSNDEIIISSLGALNRVPFINPAIFRFSRDGHYKDNLEVPEKFLVTKETEMRFGSRDNLAFSSLSSTSDSKYLFTGTEESLLQDGKTSTPTTESTTRIILYVNLKPTKEFGYRIDKVPAIKVGGLTVGETGLVELVAIDQNNFYSMERSYLPLAKKSIIHIYKNHIDDKTTDISKIDSLDKLKINPVTKTLIANLDEMGIIPENMEGLCFGPKLANGNQTLIAVSDNNFSKSHKTEFLAFEIIP